MGAPFTSGLAARKESLQRLEAGSSPIEANDLFF